MLILFVLSTVIIGVSAAMTLQHTNAASIDDGMTSSCGHHGHSDTSKKCSKNGTPLILPSP
jgi:hypothetical protein